MDIAAFKVSHSVVIDIDATALQAASSSQFSGAMEKTSRKVQKLSRHGICGVRIHIGVGQRCPARDVESPALQAKKPSA